MQVLAGPETRQEPFGNLDSLSGSRVARSARRMTRDRECAEAAQLDTISAGKGTGNLGEDGFDDPHGVVMWQARIKFGNPCDELALGQMPPSGHPIYMPTPWRAIGSHIRATFGKRPRRRAGPRADHPTAHGMAVRHALEHVFEVAVGLDVIELCRGDEGTDRCPSLAFPSQSIHTARYKDNQG